MNTDMSSSAPKENFFVARNKASAARSMSLTNVTQLTGRDTYEDWAATMDAVWYSQMLGELVMEGKKPEKDASTEEKNAYQEMVHHAVAIYIQVVTPQILKTIIHLRDPHLMWTHLRTQFHRDTAYALVYQLGSLMQMGTIYDPSLPMTSFIDSFESEYYRLTKLTNESEDEHRQLCFRFLDHDKTKRDFLLGFLSRHLKNVVDNLTTKGDLSYGEVKQRLLDLDYGETPSQTALVTRESMNLPSSKPARPVRRKICTYCKRRFPSESVGHLWFNCPRRREARGKEMSGNHEMANATIADPQRTDSSTSQFVPDL